MVLIIGLVFCSINTNLISEPSMDRPGPKSIHQSRNSMHVFSLDSLLQPSYKTLMPG